MCNTKRGKFIDHNIIGIKRILIPMQIIPITPYFTALRILEGFDLNVERTINNNPGQPPNINILGPKTIISSPEPGV
jgi:hypothetical protein